MYSFSLNRCQFILSTNSFYLLPTRLEVQLFIVELPYFWVIIDQSLFSLIKYQGLLRMGWILLLLMCMRLMTMRGILPYGTVWALLFRMIRAGLGVLMKTLMPLDWRPREGAG